MKKLEEPNWSDPPTPDPRSADFRAMLTEIAALISSRGYTVDHDYGSGRLEFYKRVGLPPDVSLITYSTEIVDGDEDEVE